MWLTSSRKSSRWRLPSREPPRDRDAAHLLCRAELHTSREHVVIAALDLIEGTGPHRRENRGAQSRAITGEPAQCLGAFAIKLPRPLDLEAHQLAEIVVHDA